jgi:GNAT superfamily N-acetyltransferase
MADRDQSSSLMMLRSALPQDIEAIAQLCLQLGYSPAIDELPNRIQFLMQSPQDHLMVAEWPTVGIVGWIHAHYCQLVMTPPLAKIMGLVVHQSYRRYGVGRSLVEQAEAWAVAQGCQSVMLSSNIVREETHRFYEHIGYVAIKRSIVFQKNWVDAPPIHPQIPIDPNSIR